MDAAQVIRPGGHHLARARRYYLGTHQPGWLWLEHVPAMPLCVSRRRLAKIKRPGRARAPWILDSGGYTELSMYGRWTIEPRRYVAEVARWSAEIGMLAWAAPMDHMCEPWVIHGGGPHKCPGTGLTVEKHQHLTTENYLELCGLWPLEGDGPCPFIPVLQGWRAGQYIWHREAYEAAGVDLASLPTVGVGSVCRRDDVLQIANVIAMVAGLPLHGFGIKSSALKLVAKDLISADSLSWSDDARHNPPLPGHQTRHQHCNNCPDWAAMWLHELPLERYGWAPPASGPGPAAASPEGAGRG